MVLETVHLIKKNPGIVGLLATTAAFLQCQKALRNALAFAAQIVSDAHVGTNTSAKKLRDFCQAEIDKTVDAGVQTVRKARMKEINDYLPLKEIVTGIQHDARLPSEWKCEILRKNAELEFELGLARTGLTEQAASMKMTGGNS